MSPIIVIRNSIHVMHIIESLIQLLLYKFDFMWILRPHIFNSYTNDISVYPF